MAEWWTLLGCLLVVALPALTIAVGSLVARPDLHPGGDEAVIEIGTGPAARLDQLLGPYSRFGWSHPDRAGTTCWHPSIACWGSTEHSWAMTVAVAAVHATAAAAIVLAVRRFGGQVRLDSDAAIRGSARGHAGSTAAASHFPTTLLVFLVNAVDVGHASLHVSPRASRRASRGAEAPLFHRIKLNGPTVTGADSTPSQWGHFRLTLPPAGASQ